MTHQLLDGHALQGRVIEICGLPGSGKTALTMHFITRVLVEEELAKVVIADNHGFFPVDRLVSMLMTSPGMTEERCLACLDRVLVSHIFDLSAFAEAVKLLVEDENDNLRILVVDNISYYFRSYAQTEIDEKMPALRYIGMLLRQLARKHNMTVITNNHVTTSYRQKGRPDSGLDCVPYLGDTWAFMLDFRIKLCIRSGEDVNRTARVTKSTYAMANESLEAVEFTINVPFIMHSCRCHRFTIF